jgi:HPt (histidine-containing phosphotransfer) domain-containing protein
MAGDKERCLAAGMDGYVAKPLRPDELFAAIERCCGRPDANRIDDSPATEGTRSSAIDQAALLAAFGGQRAILADAARVFLDDLPRALARLHGAADAGDLPEVSAAAHALKGAAGLFSQGAAFELARTIEHLARDGESAPLPAALRDLDEAARALAADLQQLLDKP